MTNSLNVLAGQGGDTRYLPLAQVVPSVRCDAVIDSALTYIDRTSQCPRRRRP